MDPELEKFRHSAAHIMAQAVKRLYPAAKLAIGPPIEEGFYYDFDGVPPFSPEDVARIEEEMNKIVASDYRFTRKEMPRKEAIEVFKKMGEALKVEMLQTIPEETVSVYTQGEFTDLCRGPHLESTGRLKAFKLLHAAGAYWRGDEHNQMLQRIYGTAFFERKKLEEHLKNLEEAKKRDHRKLGKELNLYSMHEEAGPGLIFWHPKGARLRNTVEHFWKDVHFKRGYQLVNIPHIAKVDLWKTSGHWDFYRENLYSPMEIDAQQYILKPMNCPGHILMYKSTLHSYRDLPVRFAELGTVYRYERSGVLHGMMRVRGFTQDDAHIFCTPDQIKGEIIEVLKLMQYMMSVFGFEVEIFLSTRPEKFVGSEENWDKATAALKDALKSLEIPYQIDPGQGVFYGPKIDVKLIDALKRGWQGPTIQVDFNLPERFDVTYIDNEGKHQRVVMIHRTVLGSMERFIGVLTEHYGGDFPLWLAPIQARILPLSEAQFELARQHCAELVAEGIAAEVDYRNEKIGAKIRDAETEKIPCMLILGEREAKAGNVSVRRRKLGDLGVMPWSEAKEKLLEEIAKKKTTGQGGKP